MLQLDVDERTMKEMQQALQTTVNSSTVDFENPLFSTHLKDTWV